MQYYVGSDQAAIERQRPFRFYTRLRECARVVARQFGQGDPDVRQCSPPFRKVGIEINRTLEMLDGRRGPGSPT